MPNELEMDKLVRRFGEFPRATFEFRIHSPGFAAWVKKLTRRRGEIVLVVPRGANILLHTKPHYPANVYRLPTGGIQPGEGAVAAAEREGYEEIGFKIQDLRMLGVLENVFWLQDSAFRYPSFVFQTQALTVEPAPTDKDELISGFRDADRTAVKRVAMQLAGLPGEWNEWGRFRAAPHAWLADHWLH